MKLLNFAGYSGAGYADAAAMRAAAGQGHAAARLTALSMLGSLQRELGDPDRIAGWTRVFGRVNAAAGFNRQPGVINGVSELILEVFGAELGAHARSAVGMAELPSHIPVQVEAEVERVA